MSVLGITVSGNVHLPRRERSSVTVSNFSIDNLISGDSAPTRRRTSPVGWLPIAAALTSHDGVSGGATDASTPPPTPPGLRQLTAAPAGWTSQHCLATMRRLLPAYHFSSLTGK